MNQTPKESFLNNILASHKNVIACAITLILQRRSSLTGVCTNHNMNETVKGHDHPWAPWTTQGCSSALLLWGPISITLAPHRRVIHHRCPPRQAEHTLSNANVFLVKTPLLLSHRLTCACCLCVFSIFGSIDKGPRTLTISSFSTSHCFNWASTVWNWVRLFEDSSSFCCLSTVNWLSSCHLESKKQTKKKNKGCNRGLGFVHLTQLYLNEDYITTQKDPQWPSFHPHDSPYIVY